LKTPKYLDIHTHRRTFRLDSDNVWSLSADEILQSKLISPFVSAGIHPWWIEDFTQDEIHLLQSQIQKLLSEQKLWGIGETGLDRSVPETLERQKELFLWHLDLAEKYHRPLIIHSVRAGSDLLELLKQKKPTSPWIFHDFRGNEQLMKDLLRLHPNCYFSFGLSIDNSSQVRELLPLVPIDKLFLETDDQKHLDIHEIYLRASHFLDVDLEFLKSQLFFNFKRISF
jgi:TatD DNase family protein